MEQSEIPITAKEPGKPAKPVRPVLALEREDVGDLDTVLRGYYLSQIKSMEKRKDRKLSRKLLENHLVLPKSRQRTSKDFAYIKEILGIEHGLLDRLEESRLIRRIHKTGANPIYEISHDTLVEPILSERRDREAIARFIKRTWKYAVVLLLLWFLLGMLFENSFEVLPDIAQSSKTVPLTLGEPVVVDVGDESSTVRLTLPPASVGQKLRSSDSIEVRLPINLVRLKNLLPEDATTGTDTIPINLDQPIEIPVDGQDLPETFRTFSDVVVPLAYGNSGTGNPDDGRIFARISGHLKMTTDAGVESGADPGGTGAQADSIQIELGETLVTAGQSARSVPVDVNLRLTDLFADENDRNTIRNILGDRPVTLSYTVQVDAAPAPAPPEKVEAPSVRGIEVQYSDGTSRFIPGDGPVGAGEKIHIVAAGETLYAIAKEYKIVDENGKISAEPIKKLNALRGDALSVGQALRIPAVQ